MLRCKRFGHMLQGQGESVMLWEYTGCQGAGHPVGCKVNQASSLVEIQEQTAATDCAVKVMPSDSGRSCSAFSVLWHARTKRNRSVSSISGWNSPPWLASVCRKPPCMISGSTAVAWLEHMMEPLCCFKLCLVSPTHVFALAAWVQPGPDHAHNGPLLR